MNYKFFKHLQRIYTVLLILVLSSCGTSENTFRFVFMTDVHIQPERNGVEGFETAVRHVNQLTPRPDFVIMGGDHVMDAMNVSFGRADSLYHYFIQTCEKLDMPVYYCIGNHESFGIDKRSGISSEHSEFAKEMFKKRIGDGKTYQSFDHKGWHFVLLDDIAIKEDGHYCGYIDSVQIEWLKNDLAEINPDTPVAFALHIPLLSAALQLSNGINKPLPSYLIVDNAKEVLYACGSHLPRLVLQGHLHWVEEMNIREMTLLTGGAVCANWWKGPYQGFEEGYIVVDVKGNNFNWHYETYGWQAVSGDS